MSQRDPHVPRSALRAAFARALSDMYGREVPEYTTLVDVAASVNADVLRRDGAGAERFGSIARVTAERHGAIRLGSPAEMRAVARVFAGFGMVPVGFYDLRDASASSVPVVSTAFRPIDRDELAANPFRVFTSLLTVSDERFFDSALQAELTERIARRMLFGPELLELADRSVAEEGLPESTAGEYVRRATAVFELSTEPVDRDWYTRLEAVSGVAADIGGVGSTHINHLTPRVLDIDDLYRRMTARGITMIEEIQGPPQWEGPDVLLRQTSFRALAEPRRFRDPDGTVATGSLRVRFGEVEARGVALTPAGRARYDELLGEVDRRLAAHGGVRADMAAAVWRESLPVTERELERSGLGYFTYRNAEMAGGETADAPDGDPDLAALLETGQVIAEPIVYEDFLPRSAAGIFQSNLTGPGRRDAEAAGDDRDLAWMAATLDREVVDPTAVYAAERDASLALLAERLGLPPGGLRPPDPHAGPHDQLADPHPSPARKEHA